MLMFGPAGRLWLYMLDDLRHAIRSLLAQPLWTFSAIACLAIGTGANTTGLSVINAILLRPLPFADAGELAVVRMRDANPRAVRVFTLAEYRDVAPHASLFSDLAARTFLPVSVSAGDPARMVQSEMVSDNYFRMLRLTPLAGRFPVTVDEAIVSERLWRGRFARDPSLVGRVIRVNGREVMVTGIAPEGFTGVTQLIAADMWLAADFAGENMGAQFGVIGRLQSGTTLEQARLQLDAILARTLPAQGRARRGGGVRISVGGARPVGVAVWIGWAGDGCRGGQRRGTDAGAGPRPPTRDRCAIGAGRYRTAHRAHDSGRESGSRIRRLGDRSGAGLGRGIRGARTRRAIT